jgi:pimeloyl-ACP methyl ester carboxylesterase
MGGLIALHLALRRPSRVGALVLVAPAASTVFESFREDLARQDLVTDAFFEAARRLRLPPERPVSSSGSSGGGGSGGGGGGGDAGSVAVACPVRILHGALDDTVPLAVSEGLVRQLAGADVTLLVVKDGDHRLSAPRDIELLEGALHQAYRQVVREAAAAAAGGGGGGGKP